MKRISAVVLACLVAAVVGCGGGSSTLSGKVTLKKIPLTQGEVTAFGESGEVASGTINEDGTYRIDNCPSGKVKIRVTSPDPQALADAMKAADDPARRRRSGGQPPPPPPPPAGDPSKWFAIPEMYNDPDTSGLLVEVSGSTEYDIEME